MIAVTVAFRLRPGRMPDFLPLMIENARISRRAEPGCHDFDVCRGEAPDSVFLYETYEDEAAFRAHLQSGHFRSFDAAVSDMVADKTVRIYGEVIR